MDEPGGPSPVDAGDPGRATVIVSPRASRIRGDGTRATVIAGIRDALAARGMTHIEVTEVGTPDGVRDAARLALRDRSSLVVLAGGDGTIRDAAGALAGTGTSVGIVPCGTGNLYAASIGLSRDFATAYATLARGRPRPFDTAEVVLTPAPVAVASIAEAGASSSPGTPPAAPPPVPFIVACGTGFDARLIAATSSAMKARYGVAAYFLAAGRVLDHLTAHPTVLTIDDVRTELEASVVLIANCGEAIPGRLRPRLPIDASDGLLHVFVLPRSGIIHGIRGALELMCAEAAGVSASGSAMRFFGQRVRVEVDPAQPTQLDGDTFPPAAIDARVRPGAFPVLLPA
jgi:diacylglycerol kinase (ATP)